MFLALLVQHAKRMLRIALSSVSCPALPYFSKVSHKLHNFNKEILNIKRVVIFPTSSSEIFLSLRRIRGYFIINMYRSSRKIPIILIAQNMIFFRQVFEENQISDFIKVRPVGAELFLAEEQTDGETNGRTGGQTETDRQADRQTGMMKLIVAVRKCEHTKKVNLADIYLGSISDQHIPQFFLPHVKHY